MCSGVRDVFPAFWGLDSVAPLGAQPMRAPSLLWLAWTHTCSPETLQPKPCSGELPGSKSIVLTQLPKSAVLLIYVFACLLQAWKMCHHLLPHPFMHQAVSPVVASMATQRFWCAPAWVLVTAKRRKGDLKDSASQSSPQGSLKLELGCDASPRSPLGLQLLDGSLVWCAMRLPVHLCCFQLGMAPVWQSLSPR